MKKHSSLTLFAIFILGCSFLSFPSVATPIETTETLVPNSLLGIWKADDMRAPDNSWNISYSVYIQFTNTKQYVYHGVDTFNSNQPTDVSDIVYSNDSTFIKKFINIPDHPEYLGKFQKWTWRFDNGNVLFTVYGIMDSQDLALNDGTITVLATGVKVQQPQTDTLTPTSPSPSTSKYNLKCDINTQEFGFGITGETGTVITTYHNEGTNYEYDSSGQRSGITINVNRDLVFENNQHKYHIEGTIKLNPITNELTYDITATGDTFDNSPQTCKKP
jgi:hypothetical protein